MDNVSCEQNHTITINSNLKGYNPNCFTTINNPQICFVGPILIQIIGLHIFCSVALSLLSIYFITLVTIYFANSDNSLLVSAERKDGKSEKKYIFKMYLFHQH